MRKPDYIDVAAAICEGIEQRELGKIQFMGGAITHALVLPDVSINFDDRIVYVPDNFTLSTIRPENGTLRDADILYANGPHDDISVMAETAKAAGRGLLDVQVSGYRPYSDLERRIEHPLSLEALTAAMAHRFIDDEGKRFKSIFPFAVALDEEAIKSWQLVRGEQSIPIMGPDLAMISYVTRSIGSGIRDKDREKWTAAIGYIKEHRPELFELIVDGPNSNQLALAQVAESLKPVRPEHSATKALSLPTYERNELVELASYLLKDRAKALQDLVMALTVVKSWVVYKGESSEWIRNIWQRQDMENKQADLLG
ncbi:hypothetical protein FWH58_02630 [Candidatus Saccharibacteria bacterium]|nr:hypothetical protein [Candidatus Saccharibacteria bacterium]